MTTFWSCHLIINRKLLGDRRRVRDFIDAEKRWGGISTLFLEWTPSTNANIFFAILLILGIFLVLTIPLLQYALSQAYRVASGL